MNRRLGLALALAFAGIGCASRPPAAQPSAPSATPDPRSAETNAIAGPSLHFAVTPGDAVISIDEEVVGTAAEVTAAGGHRVEPGIHEVTIERDGYQTWRSELTVKDGPERLQIKLAPVAP